VESDSGPEAGRPGAPTQISKWAGGRVEAPGRCESDRREPHFIREIEMKDDKTRRDPRTLQASVTAGTVIVTSTGAGPFEQILLDGRHSLHADEPVATGGGDTGPGPYELLLMALGSCTSMTVELYAARRKWPLEQVVVRLRHERVHAEDCADCEDVNSMLDQIELGVELIGPLDEGQRARLLQIAEKCPVHRTLTSKIDIRTSLVSS
jgi:putative redox protein